MIHAPPARLRVDAATGAVCLDAVDAVVAGPIPVVLSRSYRSSDLEVGALGTGWSLGLDAALEVGAAAVRCIGGPFGGAAFAPVEVGRAALQEATGLTLEHVSDAFVISASPRRQFVFLKRDASGSRVPLSAVRDASGSVLTLERRAGRLIAAKDPLGRVLRFEYGSGGLEAVTLAAATSAPETLARYVTSGGALRSASTSSRYTEHFDYDGTLLVEHRALTGAPSYAQYDADGRCVALWGADGPGVRLAYDALRQTTRVLDASGGQVLYRHVLGQRVLERIGHAGENRVYYYNEADRFIGHGENDHVCEHQQLDPGERRLSLLNHEEQIAFVDYDEDGLASRASDATEHSATLEWSDGHALVGLTTPGEHAWTFGRDDHGRITSVTSPEGRSVTLRWSPSGLALEDAEGTRWQETWDARGRVTGRVDRLGRRQRLRYRPDGRLEEIQIGDYSAEFLYDPAGRLMGVSDSERERATITRDTAGHVARLVAPDGTDTAFKYDPLGRVLEAQTATSAARMNYDEHDQLATVDMGGRLAHYRYEGGQTTVEDETGTRRYNRLGDLVEHTADTETSTFLYGASGELRMWSRHRDDLDLGALALEYNPDGQLSSLRGRHPSEADGHDVDLSLVYDADGWLTRVLSGGVQRLRLRYDAIGRPIEADLGGTSATFQFDGAGRMTKAEAHDSALEVAYDALDRPVAARRDGETTDFRTAPDAVWSERLLNTPHSLEDVDASWVSARVERHGVVVFFHIDGVAIPIWARSET
ncbi:DUF6531 domain-containing protein, partial [Rubrivirga sp.]|uniref:DUF6531 domain-containing protein n=1 Tax=Rubrivirga sp. TaxID=1885344 RepID=UPI003C765054